MAAVVATRSVSKPTRSVSKQSGRPQGQLRMGKLVLMAAAVAAPVWQCLMFVGSGSSLRFSFAAGSAPDLSRDVSLWSMFPQKSVDKEARRTARSLITKGEDVTQALQGGRPVIVNFYTQHCGPCRLMDPVITDLHEHYAGRVKIMKVSCNKLASQYGIRAYPTTLLFDGKHGEPVQNFVGMSKASDMHDAIDGKLLHI